MVERSSSSPTFFDSLDKDKKPKRSRYYFDILGSCNGLLLVLYYADVYLWNPAIRQCTEVLSIEAGSSRNALSMCTCGISESGHDSYSEEYKAVMVGCRGLVNIISFRRKQWDKTVCSFVAVDGSESLESGPLVNEKLHWLIPRYADPNNRFPILNRIVYFDPLTNEFVELLKPPIPNNGQHNTILVGLGAIEG